MLERVSRAKLWDTFCHFEWIMHASLCGRVQNIILQERIARDSTEYYLSHFIHEVLPHVSHAGQIMYAIQSNFQLNIKTKKNLYSISSFCLLVTGLLSECYQIKHQPTRVKQLVARDNFPHNSLHHVSSLNLFILYSNIEDIFVY